MKGRRREGVEVIAILSDLKRKEAEVVWKQEINCWVAAALFAAKQNLGNEGVYVTEREKDQD